jgi:hypothetical protein
MCGEIYFKLKPLVKIKGFTFYTKGLKYMRGVDECPCAVVALTCTRC